MKRVRHLLEYALLRVLLFFVDLLPLSICIGVAHAIGDLVWLCMPKRRAVAIENILAAGIEPDRKRASRLARTVFRQFVRVVVESLKSDAYFGKHSWEKCIAWKVPPEVDALLADPKQGVILASGHLGNWEIAAQVLSHRKPVLGITRRMNNPYVDQLMLRRKPRNRFETTPKRDADLGRLMGALRDGKVLAIMIDTNARERGMLVDFFGRPASSHTAIALLHLLTKAPLVFGYCTEVAPMRFEFRATGPFRFKPTGNKEADVRGVLEHLNRELETAIRDCPDQYLWGHRRWKLPESAPRP